MAQIAPFAGIHYAPDRVALDRVIAPPYDVLSPDAQTALYAADPHNIVRLILNREQPDDNPAANRYTRAASFLSEWLASGVMVQDRTPGLYEYVQRFEHPLEPERQIERHTLFVALTLEPYEKGIVLPHEETHPKAKADRLELMRATGANCEPIYGLYADPQGVVVSSLRQLRGDAPPLLSAIYASPRRADAEQHLLYRHDDLCPLGDIEEFFAPRRVWIADGHHRYETALNYQRERRDAEGNPAEKQPYDSLLIGLSAFEDPGLVVLPTHRLVKNVSPDRMETLAAQLERYFVVQPMPLAEARQWIKQAAPDKKRFVVLTKSQPYALTLRDLAQAEAAMPDGHCEAWRQLDVTVLQSLVLDRTLGISWTALAHTPDVAYTRDEDEAVQKVQTGEFDIACLLQNPTVTEVRDVAAEGDKMPQKSTFFFPKLWSGLILRKV